MDEGSIIRDLVERVIKNSYSPYSNFKVASAVICRDGRIFTGVNVENSSYGLSICAERVAIFKAVSEGCRDLAKVYITSDHEQPIPPCGACLQVISEFSSRGDVEIVMISQRGDIVRRRLNDMLPTRFGGGFLKKRSSYFGSE